MLGATDYTDVDGNSMVHGYSADELAPKTVDPPVSVSVAGQETERTTTPWDLGVEWLGGAGNHREFREGDRITELLRSHSHYEGVRKRLRELCGRMYIGNRFVKEVFDYKLNGIEGVGKYIADYSTLASAGTTGNLAVTYLGSHSVDAEVVDRYPNGDFEVQIVVTNSSSLQSATRPPVIGYEDWYQDTVGSATDAFSEMTGIGRTTSQTIVWTERVSQ